MLDVYLKGDVTRISPEAPVPVVRVRDRRFALGGAANVAQNVAGIGAGVELVASVGTDQSAAQLKEMLAAIGSDTRGLVPVNRPTTTKTRIVARSQQVVRVDEEVDDDHSPHEVEQLLAAAERAVESADALVLEDYNKGVLVPLVIERAMHAARAKGIPVVVDPKYRNFFAYHGATIFKPNMRELEDALGASVDIEHPATLPALVQRLGVEAVLLTLSEKGMALIDKNVADGGGAHRIPTTAREVYDVVGAGDTVTAWLAVMLAAGATPLEASVIANFAAGVEVGKLGAATVSPVELLDAYDDHASSAAK
ncbi:MAG: D-glycero-beta-D-manno-heptose-7-phosphate kinase [Gemmatimonadetes bacterium]|nr:D-glycero-beta-D-manno-heptose-7-phosphate kinase [Gemmatimonadota bacterium]